MPLYCTMVNACGRIGGYPIRSYRPQAVGRNSLGFTPMSYAGTGAAGRPLVPVSVSCWRWGVKAKRLRD